MTTTLTVFIPNSNDEELFIDIINSIPHVNFIKFSNKYPFYTLYWVGKNLYVRKRKDDAYGDRYKRLLGDDIAALALLPKEAIKSYLVSL